MSYQATLQWRKSDPAFALQWEAATARAAMSWLDCIVRAAPKDWKAAAWLLERRYPADYRPAPAVPVQVESGTKTFIVTIDGDDDGQG
jgi:hypothetical protein